MRITLDGTGCFDPDGNPLTYEWRVLGDPQLTKIVNPESTTPTVNLFRGGVREYTFELSVTDSFGAFSTDTVRIVFAE